MSDKAHIICMAFNCIEHQPSMYHTGCVETSFNPFPTIKGECIGEEWNLLRSLREQETFNTIDDTMTY